MGLRLLPSAGRLAGIALLLVGAAYSSQNAAKSYLRETDPRSAFLAEPSDGLAAVNAFAAELKTNPQFIISSHDADAARASLVSRPLNASLLSFYGLGMASKGKSGMASALMASADAVSRRDAFSQLWMIEQKSGADNVEGAVAHYNALLSVHPAMQATLLPVLVSAVAYPEVRAAIRPYLNLKTRWGASFLDLASQRLEVDQYRDLVEPIASSMRGDGYAVFNARIIRRMLQSGLAGDAWKLFAFVAPNVDVDAFRAFEPRGANLDPKWQPLSWTMVDSDGISAFTVGRGAIEVSVEAMARGKVAYRDFSVIPTATYFLDYNLVYEEGSPRASLRWSVVCLIQNEEFLILDQFVPADSNLKFLKISFKPPANCNLARFELKAQGAEGQTRSNLNITGIKLTKLN